jgi:uncharacterized repeat protein (TIGR03806 family)
VAFEILSLLAVLELALAASAAVAQVNVLTYHNDNGHTGQNLQEAYLTPLTVNTNQFGSLFMHSVDGFVYGQPLVLTNVTIAGKGIHNVVFIVTERASVYAFDADNNVGINASPLWQVSFVNPAAGITTVPAVDVGSNNLVPEVGITSTPVIDPSTGTIYVEAKTKENGTYVHRLHALDVNSGAEKFGGPVVIYATVNGTGDDTDGTGHVSFNPLRQLNRSSLALANGIVYIAYASHGDISPYHGWLLGYNAQTLAQNSVYNATANGGFGGIWQGGCGPSVDPQGNIYIVTGNGSFSGSNQNLNGFSLGDSVIKLSGSNGLQVVDFFTPFNQDWLSSVDGDLGSGAALILPDSAGSPVHRRLLVAAGKEGSVYLLDRDNLGHFNPVDDSQIVQKIPGAVLGGPYGSPAFFNNTIYYLGRNDVLKAFQITNGVINPIPVNQASTSFGPPGATPCISANGTKNGIVWAVQASPLPSGSAVLHAYDAMDLTRELYNSNLAGQRDVLPAAVKFAVPTIANGKVYVGGQFALSVFGNAKFINPPLITPGSTTFANLISVTISESTPGATIFYTLDGTVPTTNSFLYRSAIVITNTMAVKARAFRYRYQDSPVSTAAFIATRSVGTGTGLSGAYYSDQYSWHPFEVAPTLTRVDPTIDFDWSVVPPDPSIDESLYTVAWTGDVQPQFSEVYTFYTSTADGVRLWVNNQLIIDQWVDQSETDWSGSIALLAGHRYPIRMEYYEAWNPPAAGLSWSSSSIAKQIIPQSQLYPGHNSPPRVTLATSGNQAVFKADSATVQISAQASDSDGLVRFIEIFADGNSVGNSATNLCTTVLTGLQPGSHTLVAQATDDGGLVSTSAPVTITVIANTGMPYGLTKRLPLAPFLNMPPSSVGTMPPLLSQTGVFSVEDGIAALNTSDGLIPYDVNVPLWSDGALKTRWVALPWTGSLLTPSDQIGFATNGQWTFPVGTVFVKHFELATNVIVPSQTRRLETRLLVRDTNGTAYGVTYKWRPDNSDADLLTNSLSENIVVTTPTGTKTQVWYFPSSSDCLACHTAAAGFVLGLNTRQLNRSLIYSATSQTDNELRTMNQLGLFNPALNDESMISNYPALSPLSDPTASLEARARSYLDANCAQCHRPDGVAHANFDARYETPLTFQALVNGSVVTSLGVSGARVIVPGEIEKSVLYLRASTTDPAIRMPPLGRNLIDADAVSVLGDWIDLMPLSLSAPLISPNGGAYLGFVAVTLTKPDPGATIRFSLNGGISDTNFSLYSGPFYLTNSATLNVQAIESGFSDSITTSASFLIRPQPYFLPPAYFTNGSFHLQLSGVPGKSYLLQGSIDLSTWTPLSTNIAQSTLLFLTDPRATNFPHRFYRAFEEP